MYYKEVWYTYRTSLPTEPTITMKLKKIIVVVSIVAASLNSFAFDRAEENSLPSKVEQHLRDCSNYSNLVLDLTSKIDSKFSVQDAMYVHQSSIMQLPEHKQALLNDMFFSAIERKQKMQETRAELKHFLVKQCSH